MLFSWGLNSVDITAQMYNYNMHSLYILFSPYACFPQFKSSLELLTLNLLLFSSFSVFIYYVRYGVLYISYCVSL